MRTELRTHHQLAAAAERQHGAVSRAQLRQLGYSEGSIGRAVAAGRLHRVHRGVYAVGHARLSTHGRCHAAVLTCGSNALLSHTSAAWLWGLHPTLALPIEVVLPTRGHLRKGLRVHRAPALEPTDRASCEGLPVTTVPRTLLDLASKLSHQRLEMALDRSERIGLFDLGGIDRVLERAGNHPGITRLRRALDLHREPAFTRSGLERRFLKLAREAGLPKPSTAAFVAGFELDVFWEAERFAVELDGYEFHRGRAEFEADRVRQEELKLAGIEIVRLTAQRVANEPKKVMERVGALLERRRHDLQSG